MDLCVHTFDIHVFAPVMWMLLTIYVYHIIMQVRWLISVPTRSFDPQNVQNAYHPCIYHDQNTKVGLFYVSVIILTDQIQGFSKKNEHYLAVFISNW